MNSVVVTGGSGKAGRAVIRDLLEHGYAVMNVDISAPAEPLCHFFKADLNDMGQAVNALRRAPAPSIDAGPRSAKPRPSSTSPASRRRASRQMS